MERELRIESLVHGGDGLGRDDGRVIFVPLTAPGDLVRVELDSARSGARGRLLEVVQPGAGRVEPPCPVAGVCGGCQWQHVDPETQLRQKERGVAEALERIGGWTGSLPIHPIVASPRMWRYRRRLRAHLTRDGWAFSQRASNALVGIAACLLVESEVESLAHAVAERLHGWSHVRTFAVDTVIGAQGKVRASVHVDLGRPPDEGYRKRAGRLIEHVARLVGVVLTADGAAPMLVGEPVLVDREHRGLRVRPDLFTQANRLGARLLAGATAASIQPGAKVLELFAGTGTLSLALVECAGSLVATEGDGPALDLLRASLRDHGGPTRLITGPAARVVAGLADEGARFDHVVLDPPRTGAKETLPAIIRLDPERITYVSCDAPTFARDAAQLRQAGWELESVTPFDLFPHTHHVETVALFR